METPLSSRYRPAPCRALAIATSLLRGLLAGAVLVAVPALGQDLADFEKRTTVHVLDNGWTFLLVERREAPVFSFATYADVGSAQEVTGITGLAHMFEHMAFKGTPRIGTTDWAAESRAIEAMEAAYGAYQAERLSESPDPARLADLLAAFRAAQEEAGRYVVKNEFPDVLEREGAVGVNAFTDTDHTAYFYSLPSNKLELFCYMESERFLHPVFREFYQERDVVQEERRLRTESQPVGRLIEQFQAAAFVAHPYRNPVVGHMSDLESFTITDAGRFFEDHYAPANLVTAVVGDFEADELIPLLTAYFGRLPRRDPPPVLRTVEPPQIADKLVVLEDAAQPVYVEGYHKPAVTHPEQPVWDAIDDIVSRGRTSRLYRSLVVERRIAASAGSFSSFPGAKYPTLWIAYAFPVPGSSNEANRDVLRLEIERLREEPVSDGELARFKTRARAGLVRSLRDNQGMAQSLAEYQVLFGDWRELFRYLDRIDAVTAQDVLRVARETFQPSNRTVGMIVTRPPEGGPPAEGEGGE